MAMVRELWCVDFGWTRVKGAHSSRTLYQAYRPSYEIDGSGEEGQACNWKALKGRHNGNAYR